MTQEGLVTLITHHIEQLSQKLNTEEKYNQIDAAAYAKALDSICGAAELVYNLRPVRPDRTARLEQPAPLSAAQPHHEEH